MGRDKVERDQSPITITGKTLDLGKSISFIKNQIWVWELKTKFKTSSSHISLFLGFSFTPVFLCFLSCQHQRWMCNRFVASSSHIISSSSFTLPPASVWVTSRGAVLHKQHAQHGSPMVLQLLTENLLQCRCHTGWWQGDSFLTMVFTSALAPGDPPPCLPSLTLMSAKLFLSYPHSFLPLQLLLCIFLPHLKMSSQRFYRGCWWVQPQSTGGSVLQPADISLVTDVGSFWQLLTEATLVDLWLPKPYHTKPYRHIYRLNDECFFQTDLFPFFPGSFWLSFAYKMTRKFLIRLTSQINVHLSVV